MKNVMRDAGMQSYAWNGLTGWLAWLGDQQNLMFISLALGIVTALVNMYSKCREGKIKNAKKKGLKKSIKQRCATSKKCIRYVNNNSQGD
ncbi:hypothetical protein ACI3P7_11695 [Glaesserella parasuis]|uniref:hypothetical protein n=1 Tax=Glaesserella parasuis TaxID=738 RepID=UPI003853843E